jgi:hypothetical protein
MIELIIFLLILLIILDVLVIINQPMCINCKKRVPIGDFGYMCQNAYSIHCNHFVEDYMYCSEYNKKIKE